MTKYEVLTLSWANLEG